MLSFVRAFASAFSVRLTALRLELRSELLQRLLGVQVGVPDVEIRHPGEARHRRAVSADRVEHDALLVLGAKGVVARRDQHARGQPLDIPLPRSRERLVEVVDVEHQPPLGRGEDTEVRQMRIAAALDRQPGPRCRGEVVGHDHRRPAIERERRDQHPPVANRHQLRHPRLRLALEQLDGILPRRRGLEHAMAAARHLAARRLATRDALSHRQMRHRCPAFRPARRRAATLVGRLGPRRHPRRLPLDRHRR